MADQRIAEELHRRDPRWREDAQGFAAVSSRLSDPAIADALHRRDAAWWAAIQHARSEFAGYLKAAGKAV